MMDVLLFDLDGTLLPVDLETFTRNYFKAVGGYFCQVAEPGTFLKHLMFSTEAMIRNMGPTTNETVFMDNFLPAIGKDGKMISAMFNRFYEDEFPKLKQHAGFSPWAGKAIKTGLNKGYRLGLATNPLFPLIATEQRMAWAGVEQVPWELVTTYENSRGCKPNPGYFLDVCRQLQVVPEECLMIGNDVQEDLVAGTLGMTTFLVTDCLIDRGSPGYVPDHQGSLEDLQRFIDALPAVGSERK